MKLFLIPSDDEQVYVLAKNMGEAIAKWRGWMVAQSDDAVSKLDMLETWPEAIHEITDEVIQ